MSRPIESKPIGWCIFFLLNTVLLQLHKRPLTQQYFNHNEQHLTIWCRFAFVKTKTVFYSCSNQNWISLDIRSSNGNTHTTYRINHSSHVCFSEAKFQFSLDAANCSNTMQLFYIPKFYCARDIMAIGKTHCVCNKVMWIEDDQIFCTPQY